MDFERYFKDVLPILGDPGAVSGGEENAKLREKNSA